MAIPQVLLIPEHPELPVIPEAVAVPVCSVDRAKAFQVVAPGPAVTLENKKHKGADRGRSTRRL
jgi:hypothetical protein